MSLIVELDLKKTYYIPFQRTNYALGSPINRLIKVANDVKVDLFIFHYFNCFCNYITYNL